MTAYQNFLETYKLLEESVKEKTGQSVLDYENSLNRSAEGEKLQICRILRNYAAHHNDGAKFLTYPELTRFLETENQKFRSIHTTVGTVAGRQEPVTEKTPFRQVFPIMAKAKEGYVPIIDSKTREVIGILTAESLISAYSKASRATDKLVSCITKADLKRSRAQAEFASDPNTRLDWYKPGTPVILLNKDGKYQKIVLWNKLK